MGAMSLGHWIIVVGIIALLFGRNMVSSLMKDIAGGIKNAKKAIEEIQKDG